MARSQLNIRLDDALQARLAAAAEREGVPASTLVRRWIERCLASATSEPKPEPEPSSDRLAAIEARLAALEAAASKPPKAAKPDPAPGPLVPISPTTVASKASPPPKLTANPDAITGPELAEKYAVKRTSFNERVRRSGGAQVGRVIELNGDRWRCVGQVSRATGGAPLWCWEPA